MKIRFGKHKGKDIEDLPSDYIRWLIDNYDPNNEFEENFIDACYREFEFRDRFNSHIDD